jgi:cobalt-zinc-cadmium efflux system membrane fusion protein
VHWAVITLVVVLVVGLGLWATGRMQLQWRAPDTPATAKDEHGHAAGKKEEGHGEDEGRVRGDKAILDVEAVKAAGLKSEPVRAGSVGVTVEAPGEVRVPDQSLAHVTPRVSGVVREIYKARGEIVAAGAALAVIESADLGEARAAYDAAVRDVTVAEANLEAWRRSAQANDTTGTQSGWLELDQALAERQAAGT